MPRKRQGDLIPTREIALNQTFFLPLQPIDEAAETTRKGSERTDERNYRAERLDASSSTIDAMVELQNERSLGTLGNEVIKLAQALVLCSLPPRATDQTRLSRTARLSDGSKLTVTFSATIEGVDLPYGADADLLEWLIDKAIKQDSPFVQVKSANEYLADTGRTRTGPAVRDLAKRFRRLTGLVISIDRPNEKGYETFILPLISQSRLPKSLEPKVSEKEKGKKSISKNGKEAEIYGVMLESRLFLDARAHHISYPKIMWLKLQGAVGYRVRSIMTFLNYRCWCAQSESVIPWEAFQEQFSGNDSNPRRIKSLVKEAVGHLKVIWPEASIGLVPQGVLVGRSSVQLLPSDPKKNRVRRLDQGRENE